MVAHNDLPDLSVPLHSESSQGVLKDTENTPAGAKRVRLSLPQESKTFPVTPIPNKCLSADEMTALLWKDAQYKPCDSQVKKRQDYLSWDSYFMAVAVLSAQRSKDSQNPSGACLVDEWNRIIGIGYNGFPAGCSDDCLPWAAADVDDSTTPWMHTKLPYVVHAKMNAILNKGSADAMGATLYATEFPCQECAKVIVQSRIRQVVYANAPNETDVGVRASRILLTMAGVEMRQYTPVESVVTLNFAEKCEPITTTDQPDAAVKMDPNAAMRHRELLLHEANYDPTTQPNLKRSSYLSWDDYFIAMAFLTACRSKDPNTQVGACLVDTHKRIVGLGYNGFPVGCSDDHLPWARQAASPLHTKYLYVCHAEVNAILNKITGDIRNATLYVALFPCNECAKMIVQSGIGEVVYMNDQYHDTDSCRTSRILLQMAGVKLRKHTPSIATLQLILKTETTSI